MVLAHGFSDNGLCWQALAAVLQEVWEILLPDARGHGLSQRVNRAEQTDMPGDLAGLMRGLDFAPAVVGGHSMGGQIAGEFAVRYPKLTRALILEDPAWFQREPQEQKGYMADGPMGGWVRSLAGKTLAELKAECRAEHPAWPEVVVDSWCEGKKQLDQNFPYTRDQAPRGWLATAQGIRCPTLLIIADPEKGGILSAETAAAIRDTNPLIEVVHIAGTGHHIRFEAENAYTEAVIRFLSRLNT